MLGGAIGPLSLARLPRGWAGSSRDITTMIIQRRGGNNASETKGGGRDKDRDAGGEAEGGVAIADSASGRGQKDAGAGP